MSVRAAVVGPAGTGKSYLHLFYHQLLLWCDCVDVICPTPPTEMIEHPERDNNVQCNAPIPEPPVSNESSNRAAHWRSSARSSIHGAHSKEGTRTFSYTPVFTQPSSITAKRGRGRPRKEKLPATSAPPQCRSPESDTKRRWWRPRKAP